MVKSTFSSPRKVTYHRSAFGSQRVVALGLGNLSFLRKLFLVVQYIHPNLGLVLVRPPQSLTYVNGDWVLDAADGLHSFVTVDEDLMVYVDF